MLVNLKSCLIRFVVAMAFAILMTNNARSQTEPCDVQTHLQTFTSLAPVEREQYGFSVALWRERLVVGAPADLPPGFASGGSASVYDARTGARLTTLNNPFSTNDDLFGYSVAIYDDLVVVGAIFEDPAGVENAGAAYVFDAISGKLVAVLNNPEPEIDDQFGYSVAILGNLALVGSPSNFGENRPGAAYVFDATLGTLLTTLTSPTGADSDEFASSVAFSGNRALVGASGDSSGEVLGAGAVYVFDALTGVPAPKITNPVLIFGQGFGFALASYDGLIAVSAPDILGLFEAKAYVFNADSGNLVSVLNNPEGATRNGFGLSIGMAGNRVAVGAPFATGLTGGSGCSALNTVAEAGAVFVFGTSGQPLSAIYDPMLFCHNHFGNAVAVSERALAAGVFGSPVLTTSNAGRVETFLSCAFGSLTFLDVLLGRISPRGAVDVNADGALDIADYLDLTAH